MFDNAVSPAEVRGLLPPAGRGRVVITSRNPHWPLAQVVEVPVLSEQAAVDLLMARTGATGEQAARELAGELGCLPLALEQAAAYMGATGRGLSEYLTLFRGRRADLLSRGEPADYDRCVSTTWTLAFGELRRAGAPAVGLLRLLACCAAEAVPLDLLQARPAVTGSVSPHVAPMLMPLLDDPLAVDDAVAALRRYSLVSAPQGGRVSMHRLVQAVTLAQLGPDEAAAWRQAAQWLIEAALPGNPEQPKAWGTYAALLPHAQAVLPSGSDGLAEIATYLGYSGNYGAARALDEAILRDRRRTAGADHPATLALLGDLARWTGESGDPAGARSLFAALVPVYERVLGDSDGQTLAARRDLAKWTGDAGDPGGAHSQCMALAPACERVLGAGHPLTLITRATLAYWTGAAGDPAAARDRYAGLLPILERVLGNGHLEVLFAQANMARWTLEAGDPAGARDLFAALLSTCDQVLGAMHPLTLGARDELIRCTAHAGGYAAARDQLAELIPARERALGPGHPYILKARADLACWTGEAGDAIAARNQLDAVVPDCERILGAEHPQTLQARAWLAAWSGEAGEATEARDQLAALLPLRERVLGHDHPDTRSTRQSLEYWTQHAGSQA